MQFFPLLFFFLVVFPNPSIENSSFAERGAGVVQMYEFSRR